jgi:hypothetical protein
MSRRRSNFGEYWRGRRESQSGRRLKEKEPDACGSAGSGHSRSDPADCVLQLTRIDRVTDVVIPRFETRVHSA